jgi:endonuclease YncB( thermonuclease family)
MLKSDTLVVGVVLGAAVLIGAGSGRAADQLPGPINAEVVRVIDGDTIEIKALVWLGLELTSHVRIRGIDTPEIRGKCREEKTLAAAARDRLTELAGNAVRLANIAQDKFGGRVDADVANAGGIDLKTAMLRTGLARPYDGGTRADWCPVGSVAN